MDIRADNRARALKRLPSRLGIKISITVMALVEPLDELRRNSLKGSTKEPHTLFDSAYLSPSRHRDKKEEE
jgi:hypothetical protein